MVSKNLTLEQREQRLSRAIGQYVRGQITREEYERAEHDYAPDHLEAARALARTPAGRTAAPRREVAKH